MTIFYQEYRNRVRVVFFTFIFLILIVCIRLFFIHVINNDLYTNEVNSLLIKIQKLKGERGLIFDRNGSYLARNIKVYTFIVDTENKYDSEKIVKFFSEEFNHPKSFYLTKLNKKSNGIILEKNIPSFNCKSILDSSFVGLTKSYKTIRNYPYKELAAQVVGYSNDKNIGVSGVESFYNNSLEGGNGEKTFFRWNGSIYESLYDEAKLPTEGFDLTLTLDMKLQCILQEELLKICNKSKAELVNGVIVDPFSGDILAMGTVPTLDLNDYSNYPISNQRNSSIVDSYEPGSTFKIIALAAGFEEGIINENDTYYCHNGKYQIHDLILKDNKKHKNLTVNQILMHSSNIGIAKIVENFDSKLILEYAQKFGFGSKTGIQLPGESAGILNPISNWTLVSNAFVSIGQEINSTLLQTAMAYSAIANGGYIIKPKILKNITNNNEILFVNEPFVIRKVISENTATRIISMLENVVENGSATTAQIEGYKLAGKTGTAETFIDGKLSKNYISSFAGIFPSNSPQYVCVISIINPTKVNSMHYGSVSAAPTVKNIFKKIVTEIKTITPYTPKSYVGNTKI
jgi:cell division protein FtsI/penicillin-binding protein 2